MKRAGFAALVLLGAGSLLAQDTSVYMPIKIDDKATNFVDFRIGVELLRYEEAEADNKVLGKAEIMNLVGILDISQEYQQFRGGIRGIIPLTVGEEREKWDVNGVGNYQTDKLYYSWSRIDGYVGYAFRDNDDFTMPGVWYAGLRRSEGVQKRSGVSTLGAPLDVGNRKIQSYGLFVGYKGETDLAYERRPQWSEEFSPVLVADWRAEYHKPILNRVTDSAQPGALYKDRIGYTIEFGGGVSYIMSRSFFSSFNVYGGRMYWQGSDWDNFGSGNVKWPENKTDYFGANLGLLFLF